MTTDHEMLIKKPRASQWLARGICAGSQILTMDGEMPIEHVVPGDRIITRDSGIAIVKAVDYRAATLPVVSVKAGTLGHSRPNYDTVLAPSTHVLIRDWRAQALFGLDTALVPAVRLIDGEYIKSEPERRILMFTVTFDREHIVYSDGLEIAV